MTAVTCIMPTANRRPFISGAIRMFLAQDYVDKELLIIDDGADAVGDLVPSHPQIRYLYQVPGCSLGSKRNFACEAAVGDIILHWDDDDWYAPWRVGYEVAALEGGSFDVCGLAQPFFVDPAAGRAWQYVHPSNPAQWVCGATLCYRKSFWENHPFADVNIGEDSRFVASARGARIGVLDDNRFFVARIHAGNSSPKPLHGDRWQGRSN